MGGGAQALKRIPRIKFPQRHSKPSGTSSAGSSSHNQAAAATATGESSKTFFSRSPSSLTRGGKASEQPKRAPLSQDEIEAIMLGGCL